MTPSDPFKYTNEDKKKQRTVFREAESPVGAVTDPVTLRM